MVGHSPKMSSWKVPIAGKWGMVGSCLANICNGERTQVGGTLRSFLPTVANVCAKVNEKGNEHRIGLQYIPKRWNPKTDVGKMGNFQVPAICFQRCVSCQACWDWNLFP